MVLIVLPDTVLLTPLSTGCIDKAIVLPCPLPPSRLHLTELASDRTVATRTNRVGIQKKTRVMTMIGRPSENRVSTAQLTTTEITLLANRQ